MRQALPRPAWRPAALSQGERGCFGRFAEADEHEQAGEGEQDRGNIESALPAEATCTARLIRESSPPEATRINGFNG